MHIGIDIGGTDTKLSVIGEDYSIIKKWSIPTDTSDGGNNILPNIVSEIEKILLETKISGDSLLSIGIGVPGPADSKAGIVKQAVNLNWGTVHVREYIQNYYPVPVYVLNDANAAALGEKSILSDKVDNFAFITLGTGVGGGLVVNDNLIVGSHFAGGEVGHIPLVSEEKRVCGCGNINCLETFASANGLLNTAERVFKKYNKPVPEGFTTKMLMKMVESGDKVSSDVFEQYIEHLALGCASIANTIDPSHLIIGGGLSNVGDFLIDRLRTKMQKHLFPALKEKLIIQRAALGNDAGLVGSVYYGKNL